MAECRSFGDACVGSRSSHGGAGIMGMTGICDVGEGAFAFASGHIGHFHSTTFGFMRLAALGAGRRRWNVVTRTKS
jgi:hypothetical protein